MLARLAVIFVAALGSAGCWTGQETRTDGQEPIARGTKGAVVVPNLIGRQRRGVEDLLAARRLRWSDMSTGVVESEPPPPRLRSTADDDFIIEQAPEAGTRVPPRSVVRIRTSCSLEPLPDNAICID